jgi:hypothetical protein
MAYPKYEDPCRPMVQREISFKILLLIDNVSGHPRALMEMNFRLALFSCLLARHPLYSSCIKEKYFMKYVSQIWRLESQN